jgi:hypothetical protein
MRNRALLVVCLLLTFGTSSLFAQSRCTFSLSASSASIGSGDGTGTVNVISGGSGCTGSWSSSPNATWLSVSSGGSGSGAGTTTLTYAAAANESASARSGTLTIAGHTFTVNQAGSTGCSASSTQLCLSTGSRFKVSATWQTSGGQTGNGQAVPITTDTGYMWFFGSSNVEMVVKVIDACSFNQRFWVFAGGLTDVKVNLTVTDTKTGTVKTYTNPLGVAFQPIQDTSAFATCP